MSEKVEQTLFWPKAMLEHLQGEAVRLDRSLSWCVQKAWTMAGGELAKLEPGSDEEPAQQRYEQLCAGDATAVKQTLYFPVEMLQEIKDEALRLDRPLSWLVQRAWCLAADGIAALPSAA